MRYVNLSGADLTFEYTVVAGDNARAFGLTLPGAEVLKDTNGNTGLAVDTGIAAALAAVTEQGRRT